MEGKLTVRALLLSSLIFTGQVMAADGTVHFLGEIVDSACEVTTDTKDQVVELGKVNKTSFSGVDSTAAPASFSIKLEKCPGTYTKAAVRFDGTEVGDGNLAIGNPLTDVTPGDYTGDAADPLVATGVGIRIYNRDDNSQVKLFNYSSWSDIQSGEVELKFIARYIQVADAVTAGTANADSQFTVEYQK